MLSSVACHQMTARAGGSSSPGGFGIQQSFADRRRHGEVNARRIVAALLEHMIDEVAVNSTVAVLEWMNVDKEGESAAGMTASKRSTTP
jgi:pyruvate dehydrogenase complex dehydrogenase (E1) component